MRGSRLAALLQPEPERTRPNHCRMGSKPAQFSAPELTLLKSILLSACFQPWCLRKRLYLKAVRAGRAVSVPGFWRSARLAWQGSAPAVGSLLGLRNRVPAVFRRERVLALHGIRGWAGSRRGVVRPSRFSSKGPASAGPHILRTGRNPSLRLGRPWPSIDLEQTTFWWLGNPRTRRSTSLRSRGFSPLSSPGRDLVLSVGIPRRDRSPQAAYSADGQEAVPPIGQGLGNQRKRVPSMRRGALIH